MKTAISNLFGTGSTKQELTVTWARERTGRELRRFVADRHDRLTTIDLVLDELG